MNSGWYYKVIVHVSQWKWLHHESLWVLPLLIRLLTHPHQTRNNGEHLHLITALLPSMNIIRKWLGQEKLGYFFSYNQLSWSGKSKKWTAVRQRNRSFKGTHGMKQGERKRVAVAEKEACFNSTVAFLAKVQAEQLWAERLHVLPPKDPSTP